MEKDTTLPEAYQGDETYIFVSYKHEDGAKVFPLIKELMEQGYRVWYDEGITPSKDFRKVIANALVKSDCFLVFLTAQALESEWVMNEINMACDEKKPVVAIHLEKLKLPPELRLQLGRFQAIKKWRLSGADCQQSLRSVLPDTLRNVAVALLHGASVSVRRAGDMMAVKLPGGVPLEMVWCPPGTFWMGSPKSEEGREDEEFRHRVTLTKGFCIGKFPVTQRQWLEVMGDVPAEGFGFPGRKDYPAEKVSWNNICKKQGGFLAELNGLGLAGAGVFRLPTEAEWEYACRAGTTGNYNVNGAGIDDFAWYRDNSGGRTHPVGQKRSNAWGIHDMHGNVWEWCADWRCDCFEATVTDPAGPDMGDDRVIRGGAWCNDASKCRSAYRGRFDPDWGYGNLGFRLVFSSGLGS